MKEFTATSPSGKAKVCKIFIPGSNPGVAFSYICCGFIENIIFRMYVALRNDMIKKTYRYPADLEDFREKFFFMYFVPFVAIKCRSGGIGRHKGLKIPRTFCSCRFKSGLWYHNQSGQISDRFYFLLALKFFVEKTV